jgi:hypothetical protein
MVKVSYTVEIITANKNIDAQGAACISFENLGETEATIKGDIPLTTEKIREFNNDPGSIIVDSFPLQFASGAGTKKILIVRTYYID